MMYEETILSHENFKDIKTQNVDGIIYYRASDVCDNLKYPDSNRAIRKFCNEDGIMKLTTMDSSGRPNRFMFISAPNVEELIKWSALDEDAKNIFSAWILGDETNRNVDESQLTIFNNSMFGNLRTVLINGNPYFVGADVTSALQYSKASNVITNYVDSEDRVRYQINTQSGKRSFWMINESGLYSLIMQSRMETAKQFKHWVTSEVLPAIRKDGVYMTTDVAEKILQNPDFIIQLAQQVKEARIALEAEKKKNLELTATIKEKEEDIKHLTPKAKYYDMVLQSPDLVPITTIAKDYGWSGMAMNNYLRLKQVQYKQGQIWLLRKKYAQDGYGQIKTFTFEDKNGGVHVSPALYWTQKGRLLIYNMLKADGILPVMERIRTEQK